MKKSKFSNLVVSRIVSAIEKVQFKEINDGTISLRRMFAQTNIRKAMQSTPEEDLLILNTLDVYDIAAIIAQPDTSPWGQEVARVLRYGVNGYYYSV